MEFLATIKEPLMVIISMALVYLFRENLKVNIEQKTVENILDAIADEILKVEETDKEKIAENPKFKIPGAAKKQLVISHLNKKFQDPANKYFTAKKKTLLEKTFGTLETAVEKAFQLTHLARSVKKLF